MIFNFRQPVYLLMLASSYGTLAAQNASPAPIPATLGPQFSYNSAGVLQAEVNGKTMVETGLHDRFKRNQMYGSPVGTASGIALDFHDDGLDGTISYGTYNDSAKYPTILFLPRPAEMKHGKAVLELKKTMTGTSNDFLHLMDKGSGIVGFRVINAAGHILYEGRVAVSGKGPFTVLPTLVEGPLVNMVTSTGTVFSYETQVPVLTSVEIDGKTYKDPAADLHHELAVSGLKPDTEYAYTVHYGERTDTHRFRTAPAEGSRKPFSFAFVADNRSVKAGGERDLGEVNYLTTRAGMASAVARGIRFMQVLGGNSTGNNTSRGGHLLEHANWKRALEPFWASVPVYAAMGNHEENYFTLATPGDPSSSFRIERFPYATEAGAVSFAASYVLPTNGPEKEDGDFPTYKENVYFYTYGNVAVIVLNTEYWKSTNPAASGSPEGYMMDRQLEWLDHTIQAFEANAKIDHVFVTTHSAMFPSGDHTDAGMWYFGDNAVRPLVAGKPVEKGILERRDQIIDVCINKSHKVVGFLTGSEHNFSTLEVTPGLSIYPESYSPAKLKLKRSFFVINNGGGGAYAYARMNDGQYRTPWNDKLQHFTGPASMAIVHVDGAHITVDAYNPETFEPIADGIVLR